MKPFTWAFFYHLWSIHLLSPPLPIPSIPSPYQLTTITVSACWTPTCTLAIELKYQQSNTQKKTKENRQKENIRTSGGCMAFVAVASHRLFTILPRLIKCVSAYMKRNLAIPPYSVHNTVVHLPDCFDTKIFHDINNTPPPQQHVYISWKIDNLGDNLGNIWSMHP